MVLEVVLADQALAAPLLRQQAHPEPCVLERAHAGHGL
jgi:hypothetical protein